MAGGFLIAIALIAGLILPLIIPAAGTNITPEAVTTAGTQLAIQEGDLLEPGETAEYDTSPPTSGPSWAEAAVWGAHEEQAPDEADRPQPAQRRSRVQLQTRQRVAAL